MSFSANYPTTAPSLLLDFANSNTVDPRVTFTRASTATYFNSIGSLTTAAINSPRLDYDPTTLASQGLLIEEQRVNSIRNNTMVGAAVGTPGNLPTNWTFGNTSGLTTTVVGTGTQNGINYIDIKANGTTTGTQFTLLIESNTQVAAASGQTWTTSAWVAAVGGSSANIGSYEINTLGRTAAGAANEVSSTFFTPSGTFTRQTNTFTFASGTTAYANARVAFNFPSGAAIDITLRIGLPQLELGAFATSVIPTSPTFTSRASTGTFFDSTGTLQTAAINVARNNYNPASLSTPPLLLIEEARTNSIRNNTMVGAVAGTPGTDPTNWFNTIPVGLTQQIVGTGTENGITYIDYRFSGTATGSIVIRPDGETQVVASSGQAWTGSGYVRLVGGSLANVTCELNMRQGTAAAALVLNTQVAFTPTSAALNTQRIISAVASMQPTTERILNRFVLSTTGAIDITLRIGLPQLELGAYPTSVIPTTTVAVTRSADLFTQAAVTRSADVASVNTLTPWYNATEGTLYGEVSDAAITVSGVARRIANINDGTESERITVAWAGGTGVAAAFVTDGGVAQAAFNSPSGAYPFPTKVALAYKTADFQAAVNGNAFAAVSSGTLPTVNRMTIGDVVTGTTGVQSINGHIRRITYYPIRLSNANLQALTS